MSTWHAIFCPHSSFLFHFSQFWDKNKTSISISLETTVNLWSLKCGLKLISIFLHLSAKICWRKKRINSPSSLKIFERRQIEEFVKKENKRVVSGFKVVILGMVFFDIWMCVIFLLGPKCCYTRNQIIGILSQRQSGPQARFSWGGYNWTYPCWWWSWRLLAWDDLLKVAPHDWRFLTICFLVRSEKCLENLVFIFSS